MLIKQIAYFFKPRARNATDASPSTGRQSLLEADARTPLRSSPAVHELTSHCIQYKQEDTMERYRSTTTAPTNMTHLPCVKVYK